MATEALPILLFKRQIVGHGQVKVSEFELTDHIQAVVINVDVMCDACVLDQDVLTGFNVV